MTVSSHAHRAPLLRALAHHAAFSARLTWMRRHSVAVGLFAYTLPAAATIAVWQALSAVGLHPGGYAPGALAAYTLAARLVSAVTVPTIHWQVERETTGQTFACRLLRPSGTLAGLWGEDIGRLLAGGLVAAAGTGALLLGCAAAGIARLPALAPGRVLLAVADLPLTWLLLEAGFSAAAAQSVGWTRAGDVFYLAHAVLDLLAGVYVPLDLFPVAARRILAFTPVPYLFAFPADLALGRTGLLPGLPLQARWAGLLLLLAGRAWRRAIRRMRQVGD